MTDVILSTWFMPFFIACALLIGLIGVLMMIAGLIVLSSVSRMIREDNKRNSKLKSPPPNFGASHD